MTLAEMFKVCDIDYLEFDMVEKKLSQRPDIHAFMLLDRLQPGSFNMISAAEHDEFTLSIDCDELGKVVTLDQVRDLYRCGVRYSEEYNLLSMFT